MAKLDLKDLKDNTIDKVKELCDYVCEHNDSVRINTERLDYLRKLIEEKGYHMPCHDIQMADKFLSPLQMSFHEFLGYNNEKWARELRAWEAEVEAEGKTKHGDSRYHVNTRGIDFSRYSQEDWRELILNIGTAYGFLYIEQSESKND